MPELPDVEGFRRFLDRYGSGKRITRVEAEPEICRNTNPQGLGRALTGNRLDKAERHGKWLVCPAGASRLLLHFGMTGQLVWSGTEPDRHPHDRVVLRLEDGELRYRNQRKLGGAWLARAGQSLQDVIGPLGPDALHLSRGRLAHLLGRSRGGIKSALMDQELIAGLGNITVDEILWTARIDPRRARGDLGERGIERIERSARQVLRASVAKGRVPSAPDWLTSQRGEEDARCPRCKSRLEVPQVAGRTTYICPRCQK